MSKTVSCPFCQTAITIDENASVVVCLACGKGFSLGVAAQSGSMPQVPPPQYQTMPPQYQTMQPQIERRRPGTGLFVTGIIFNSLAIIAGIGICVCLIGMLANDDYYGYRRDFITCLIGFSFFGSPFILTAFILNLVSIAKYWSLLPSQFSRGTTPGEAAGFMLIPFFNLYWIWALHLRLGAGLRQSAARPNSAKGCGIWAAILIFLGSLSPFTLFLQYVGYLIGICGYHKAAKSIEP